MAFHPINGPIFENGKLKPGVYQIQNIKTETFLDIEVHTRELCCRPERDLGRGRGFVRQLPLFFFSPVSDAFHFKVGNQTLRGRIYGEIRERADLV